MNDQLSILEFYCEASQRASLFQTVFNLEIRVANDLLMALIKRLNFMFETVMHADLPHSRTPV